MEDILSFDVVLKNLKEKGVCFGKVKPTEYHAMKPMLEQALGVPVVSKSSLCDFMANPYKYKWALDNGVRKTSEAMSMGSLVDCLVLTPEDFEGLYLCEEKKVAVKKDGTPYSNGMQDPEQKARWQAAAESGVTVVSVEQLAKGNAIAEQATAHLSKHGLKLGVTFESQCAMWVYLTELDGIELVCPVVVSGMIDILPTGELASEIWDLKTTSEDVSKTHRLEYTTEDFHYGIQAAMYLDMYNLATGEAREAFTFLFAGTAVPYMSRCLHMTAEVVELYRAEYRNALRAYCLAWKMDDWGTPELETHVFMPSRREWARLLNGDATWSVMKGDAR
jgi:hypothetical protein